jgi:Trk K+ transport system NAD-binding subunit
VYTMFGNADWFLICGLGSLGQHCVVALKEFEVGIIAIDLMRPQSWEIANIPNLLDTTIWGDCRHQSVLAQAKIGQCRAALILTNNEQTNIETALAIRQINPDIRLAIRSSKTNLNRLLSEQLGNFTAYDPAALPARAFALAALGSTTLGSISLAQHRIQVVQQPVAIGSPWLSLRHLHEFDTPNRRLLAQAAAGDGLPTKFHHWERDRPICVGDRLVYVEIVDPQREIDRSASVKSPIDRDRSKSWRSILGGYGQSWRQRLLQFSRLKLKSQVRRLAILYGFTVVGLTIVGSLLFHQYYPNISLWAAFFDTAILLLGGYGDLFGNFQQLEPIPWWLRLFALGLTIVGTAFVGVLYAILTEALLSSKFQFIQHRPVVPARGHITIVGLGRIGQQVAAILHDLHQPLVGMTLGTDVDSAFLPYLPIVTSNLSLAAIQAHCATAESVVIVTPDEILNLEIALMIQAIDPASRLVLRTEGEHLSTVLPQILPAAQILGVDAVAAEAFAGAAFGEHIIDLFRFNNQTILVTEYQVEQIDTLNGLLLADVVYGYEAIPILHQQPQMAATLLPPDDITLAVGDRLVVMATIDGLRRIEQGKLSINPRTWRLRIEAATSESAIARATKAIAAVAGCPVATIRQSMLALPAMLPILLYQHQGQRLVADLARMQVRASLIPLKKARK